MPIKNYEEQTPDLVPLDQVKINLDGVHFLQLKSNFNEDEVRDHFVPYVAKRLLAYQVMRFLDFMPEFNAKDFKTNSELITDHTSQINKDAGLPEKIDFYKFTASVKDTLQNDFTNINNGESKISVDWMLSCCFLDLTNLKNVMLVNQEDLPFKEEEASYFGRSVLAVVLQQYYEDHEDYLRKNFDILNPKSEGGVVASAAIEHLSKQRDIHLSREETIKHLKGIECQKTGVTADVILTKEFDILK